ncbi:unnamed protein product [Closterium sp. Naga37s-1]|nr:unnamed protein product [Closterium sp. Naga37s-1]
MLPIIGPRLVEAMEGLNPFVIPVAVAFLVVIIVQYLSSTPKRHLYGVLLDSGTPGPTYRHAPISLPCRSPFPHSRLLVSRSFHSLLPRPPSSTPKRHLYGVLLDAGTPGLTYRHAHFPTLLFLAVPSLPLSLPSLFPGLSIPPCPATPSSTPKRHLYGVLLDAGTPGLTYRHAHFPTLLEIPFDGATTVASLFVIASRRHHHRPLLGTRKFLSRETVTNEEGKEIEKLEFGEYEWESYSRALDRAEAFGGGLRNVGHGRGEAVAIVAETRADFYLALQGAFQQSLVVVMVYASLGQEALVHALNETEVTTVICDHKQLEKLEEASSKGELKTVQRVIMMPEPRPLSEAGKGPTEAEAKVATGQLAPGVKLLAFADVEKSGVESPVTPELPQPSDLAVIMYTSGSTGLPKVSDACSEWASCYHTATWWQSSQPSWLKCLHPPIFFSSPVLSLLSPFLPPVMLSHGNLVAVFAAIMAQVPDANFNDVYIAYLPLSHVLELAAELGAVSVGGSIGYGSPLTLVYMSSNVKPGIKGDSPETLLFPCVSPAPNLCIHPTFCPVFVPAQLGAVSVGGSIGYGSPLTLVEMAPKVKLGTKGDAPQLRPTLMVAVPAILDRIRDAVRRKIAAAPPVRRTLFNLAYSRRLAAIEGSWFGAWGVERLFWDLLVFRKVRYEGSWFSMWGVERLFWGLLVFRKGGCFGAWGIERMFWDLLVFRKVSAVVGESPLAWGVERLFWDLLVFRKVRAAVGGHLRFMLSGGAPLSPDSQRFMNICFNQGYELTETAAGGTSSEWDDSSGYGLTETAAGGTFSEWDDSSVGRVGPPIPCNLIRLIDWEEGGYRTTDHPHPRGEILIGGPNEDPQGMRWFRTGDIGAVLIAGA